MLNELLGECRFYMPMAVLAFQSISGSFATAMGVFSSTFVVQALLEIPTGVLSDKWKRRNVFCLAVCCEFVSILCYALAFRSSHPLVLLYSGATLYGFANALFSGNNQALVYETLSYYRRTTETAKVFGRIASMGQIALGMMGLVSAGLLWAGVSYETLTFLTLVPLALNMIVAFLIVEPPYRYIEDGSTWEHMKKAWHLVVSNKKLRLYAIANIIQAGGGLSNYYFTPAFVQTVWPIWLTSLYRTGQHFLGAVSFWFAGPIIKTFGAFKVLWAGNIIANGLCLIAFAITNALSPILIMLTQVAYGTGTTAQNTVQQESFSDAQRSTMGSLISLGIAVMSSIMSILMGWVADMTSPVITMASFMVVRAVIVQGIYSRIYNKHHKTGKAYARI